MNETLNTIARRYSCRAFDGRPVEKEKIEAIALAAVQAPSAMNIQPWRVVAVTDKAWIEAVDSEGMHILAAMDDKSAYDRMMSRGGKLLYNTPAMFIVLKKSDCPSAELDCGIVCQNIALSAVSLGLGSLICGLAKMPLGGEKAAQYREKLGIEDGWEIAITILTGYEVEPGTAHEPDMSKITYVNA